MYKERIRSLYDQLSPGYRRIAQYLLGNYRDAAFMTAAEIARAVQVDTALVVRFAQRLGYPGFPELSNEVQEEVKQDLRAVYEPPEGDDSPFQIFRRNLLQDRNNLDYMLQHIDQQAVASVIELLANAPRIFVVGETSMSYIAEAFVLRLQALGYGVQNMPGEVGGQAAVTATMRTGDVLVGLEATAISPGVATALKVAGDEGVHTVAIVPSVTNPAAAVAQHVLLAPMLTVGMMPSWTAAAAVLQALSQALSLSRGPASVEWAVRTNQLRKSYVNTFRGKFVEARDVVAGYNLLEQAAPEKPGRD